jgi:hypothetical protein
VIRTILGAGKCPVVEGVASKSTWSGLFFADTVELR